MSEEPANGWRIARWHVAALFAPVVAIALILLAIYVEESALGTVRIESVVEKTPLGLPLRAIAGKIAPYVPTPHRAVVQ
jgi:hypothetical protein